MGQVKGLVGGMREDVESESAMAASWGKGIIFSVT